MHVLEKQAERSALRSMTERELLTTLLALREYRGDLDDDGGYYSIPAGMIRAELQRRKTS